MTTARSAIESYLRGEASAAITVAELLLSVRDIDRAERAIEAVQRGSTDGGAYGRLADLLVLLNERRGACGTIVQMLDVIDGAGNVEQASLDVQSRIERCASMFDVLVGRSEESSVAFYSLGSADLLDRATNEVIDRMRRWDLVAPDRFVLQIGCGTGRFEEKLSGSVAEAHGIDISASMIEASRSRCRHLSNVRCRVGSGRDLRPYGAARFDLVYAVDSMPYVVEVGSAVAADYFAEAARVLKGGGKLLIYNYSYRGDPLQDDRDVVALADENGFELVICGARPFSFWNGREYLLRRVGT